MAGLGRFFRRGIYGRAVGVGVRVYRYLTDSTGRTFQTSGGRPFRTSEDLRFMKTSKGKIFHTSGGRPMFVKVSN